MYDHQCNFIYLTDAACTVQGVFLDSAAKWKTCFEFPDSWAYYCHSQSRPRSEWLHAADLSLFLWPSALNPLNSWVDNFPRLPASLFTVEVKHNLFLSSPLLSLGLLTALSLFVQPPRSTLIPSIPQFDIKLYRFPCSLLYFFLAFIILMWCICDVNSWHCLLCDIPDSLSSSSPLPSTPPPKKVDLRVKLKIKNWFHSACSC